MDRHSNGLTCLYLNVLNSGELINFLTPSNLVCLSSEKRSTINGFGWLC